jgi:hypothetical protein
MPSIGPRSRLAMTTYSTMKDARYGEHPPGCPRCGNAVGLLPWLPPYRVILDQFGDEYEDIVLGAGGSDFLVSERLLSWWAGQEFSGLDNCTPTDVVRVRCKKPHSSTPQYYSVSIEHDQSQFDSRKSKVIRSRRSTCTLCEGYDLDSIGPIVFIEESLTGKDMFRCINGYIIALSKRAYCGLRQQDFTLGNITSASDYSWGR